MILDGFLDELVKVGALRRLVVKTAYSVEPMATDSPDGMVNNDPVNPAVRVVPEEAKTRLPLTEHLQSLLSSGAMGSVDDPKEPIDKEKHNRPFEDGY